MKTRLIKIYKLLKQKFWGHFVRKAAASVGEGLKVNYKTHVTSTTYLGNNVNFNGMDINGGGKVIIGDNFHSGKDCLIITQNHNYEGDQIPYDSTYIIKDVIISDNVWLGDRVIILPGSKLGEGAIIQAGSVVTGEIPAYAIAGGHPAKPFGQRDIAHYEQLKKERKFH